MSWTLLIALVLVLGFALLVALARRAELARMERSVRERDLVLRRGSETQLRQPVVDLSRCLGCGTCVAACPEDNVLELVHGQAMVVNGGRCVGISACERECPVGAITVTVANLEHRNDVPNLSEELEAVGSPGLFLAGEVTAHALIKTAVDQGAAVGAEVTRRLNGSERGADEVLDLCIVGAGPAGIACSLEAKRGGLHFMTVDQETDLGGTVAKYPRKKLVMTQPVEMPIYGKLPAQSYTKEELIRLWRGIAAEQELPIRGGEAFEGLAQDAGGNYVVRTSAGEYAARNVCLALGRRGTPNQLGVPGEELPKVAYSLMDAHSYTSRRILVVGGGDSAVEAALGLAEQPGNEVTLSYRRDTFARVCSVNREQLETCLQEGRLQLLLNSQLLAIQPETVELTVEREDGTAWVTLPNDDVFVMAGGKSPVELLSAAGVSFDASGRSAQPLVEQGTGLVRALTVAFAFTLAALLWAGWHADYYALPRVDRPAHVKHGLLRPSQGVGLGLGIVALVMIGVNLVYLVRRSPRFRFQWGSLQHWMTSHVATGILALLCALLHGAMAPRDSIGGHAFLALCVLLVTGAIGRYLYAWMPRAANGRELELLEIKLRLGRLDGVGAEVTTLIENRQWKSSFCGRVLAWIGVRRDFQRALTRHASEARAQGTPDEEIERTTRLAREAHRLALTIAHYEDVRAVLGSWRYLHRWVAALMVILAVVHVVYALAYGESSGGVPR